MKSYLKRILCTAGLTAAACHPAAAQQPKEVAQVENHLFITKAVVFADSTRVRYPLKERMAYYGVPSVSIAVIDQGKLAWARAYGYADEAAGRPADSNTLYQAASLSKMANALAVLKLSQDGKLSLDADIRTYLKNWTFPDNAFSAGKTITLKNLLSHTAGLSTGGFRGYLRTEALPTTGETLNGLPSANNEAVKPIFAPGTRLQYSGGGTVIARQILQDQTGIAYDQLLDRTILAPLGMHHSTFAQPLPAAYTNFAAAYDQNRKPFPGGYLVYPEQAPDGLWTTPADYARMILCVQLALAGEKGLLDKATAELMLTPVLPGSDAALGVFIKAKPGEDYFSHTGANQGYRTVFYAGMHTGQGVVVMVNSDNDQILNEIVNSVAEVYHWKGFYEPQVRKLAKVPDSLLRKYAGEYRSVNPSLMIRVRENRSALELSARGDGNFERMYFTAADTFFLLSSPDVTAHFLPGKTAACLSLEVKQGDKVQVTAEKQPAR